MKIETEDDVRFWLESCCEHADHSPRGNTPRMMICSRCVAKAVYAVLSSRAVEAPVLSIAAGHGRATT